VHTETEEENGKKLAGGRGWRRNPQTMKRKRQEKGPFWDCLVRKEC